MLAERLIIKTKGDVYEPAEDSFLLAGEAEKFARGKVLDLCTGSGIQGITAALKGCEVTFSDTDYYAIECAKENASANRVTGKFIVSDLFQNISGKFDTIIFNPPYLPSEPIIQASTVMALDGGKDGRVLIDRFLAEYKNHLLPNGIVLMVESSLNNYQNDIAKLNAEVAAKAHYQFEDIVVLKFS